MNFAMTTRLLKIDLKLKSGDLTIFSEDRQDLEIEFPDLRKGTIENDFEVNFENDHLVLKEKENNLFGLNRRNSSDVILRIPEDVKLEGSIKSYSGDLQADTFHFCGDISVYAGDLSFETFIGELELKSYSGDVTIDDGEFSALHINSYSGDVKIKAAFKLNEDAEIKSMSGDVAIDFTSYRSDKTITINSLSGDINTSGAIPENKIMIKHNLKNLGQDINAKIMRGLSKIQNIAGKKSDLDEVKIEINPHKNDRSENNLDIDRILSMVESGRVTVDEAERLIKALG
ncbi:MAG: DUF4097 family beta strand repeat protein [Bdellovibrio sp.]|nr:DUF4097 family beta strand repeat protein [Bdellovibrio sp.]